MSKRLHHIADDLQRGALIRAATRKAADLAWESFYHALMVEGLDDEALGLFAREVWEELTAVVEFDYPQYAQALFLGAYQMAYRAYLRELPNGRHPSTSELAQAFEAEIGLTSGQA